MRIFKAGRSGTPINQELLAQYRSRAQPSCRPRAHGHVTLQCLYMQTHRRRGVLVPVLQRDSYIANINRVRNRHPGIRSAVTSGISS